MNKSTLVLTDEVMKDKLHYIGYGFRYDFHDNIAEGYAGTTKVMLSKP